MNSCAAISGLRRPRRRGGRGDKLAKTATDGSPKGTASPPTSPRSDYTAAATPRRSWSQQRNAEDYVFARDLGLPISVHVGMAGTADAVTTLQRDRLLGADVNYVHANMLTDREFDLIAETQGTWTGSATRSLARRAGNLSAASAVSLRDSALTR